MAIPIYAFVLGVLLVIGWGVFRSYALGEDLRAESAGLELAQQPESITSAAFVFLALRAFSSGSAALTGVEAVANGVPAFQKPESRNAATTLAMMGALAITIFIGLLVLAHITGVVMAEDPRQQLIGAPPGYDQVTLMAQVANAVFAGFPPAVWYLLFFTGLILVLAGQYRFQRFSGAWRDPGSGTVSAAPTAHARRPVGLLQRNSVPRGRRDPLGGGGRDTGGAVDPAVHRRGIRVVRAQSKRYDPSLAAAVAGGKR